MCTVTFVCSGNKKIITSNRDEQVIRQAIEPKKYLVGNKNITFPKDPKAGGTWYAVDEFGNVLVLLNGAAEKHEWHPPYRKSRGIILLDILSAKVPSEMWNQIDLDNIEPFTLVLFQNHADLFQMRWDGNQKSTVVLNPDENHIWSSATLYPKEIREKREKWFAKFMDGRTSVSEDDLFQFHRYTKKDNSENGLVIDREGFLKTISITQTIINADAIVMKHFDLVDNITSETAFTTSS